MKRAAIVLTGALAGLLASTALEARIVGEVSECGASSSCMAIARLRLFPDPIATQSTYSLFVGIIQLVNGQPNPAVAGWFDGRQWKAGVLPTAAWTGKLSPRNATIRIPGGVCNLVKRAGGPAGQYALYAGWGRSDADRQQADALNEADTEQMIREADPETAARLRELLKDYRAAKVRQASHNASDSAAFTNMRSRNSFWQIRTFDCGEG